MDKFILGDAAYDALWTVRRRRRRRRLARLNGPRT